ncbi:unnamed protein product [Phytophthora lilii]|uniref:Unnamed protein product n=1 Tax=Phytophthora lilii TaxID=2077276 RepID=A0A9W6UAQ3_9STRA|nr:unnamed protein product [Phytophthora lilii]
MDPSASIFPCVLDAPPRHFRVPPTAPAPAADASDFEMFCDRLVLQGVELAQELKDFLEAAVQRFSQAERSYEALLGDTSRFWRWLELLPAGEEDQEKLLPLPVPAVYPLSLQQMDFVVNGLDDVKTAVQVLSGSVDNFETQREREQAKLCRLLEQLLQAPTCQCEVREEASSSQRLPTPTAPMAKKSGSTMSGAPIKVQLPWASRLEVPL